MKEGGMDNLDKHISEHTERDSVEGEPEGNKGQGYIDKDEAWVTAHAEKPFRDAARNEEYLEKAQAGTKEFLDWVASEEGEKALELFRTQSGAEKDRAREILLSKAIEKISIRDIEEDIGWRRKGEWDSFGQIKEEDRKQILLGAVEVGRIIVRPEIEKILDGKETDKPNKVACVAAIFSEVLEKGKPDDLPEKFSRLESLFGRDELKKYVNEADLAWRLARGGDRVVGGFRGLALLEMGGYEANTTEVIEKKTKELIRDNLELITEVREGRIAGGVSEEFKRERAQYSDADLEKIGFVFDEKSRRYIEVK